MAETTPSDKYKIAGGAALIAIAVAVLLYTNWPQHKANLNRAFYSDDDGKTWFADSAFKVPPFDHDGKTAVSAEVFSYDGGSKEFCAYLSRYTTQAKTALDSAIADAQRQGKSLDTVELFHDRGFIQRGMQAKRPGDSTWTPYTDPHIADVFSVRAPDGSTVDQVFAN